MDPPSRGHSFFPSSEGEVYSRWSVVVVQSVGDMFIAAEPVLEISHTDDDLFLTGFTFDEVQTMEIEDFCGILWPCPLTSMGAQWCSILCGACPIYPAWGWVDVSMDRARESEGSTDPHTFYYPLRPYTRSLADYFVRASEPHAPSDGIVGGLSTTQEAELQRLVQQLRLRDGAPGPSTSVLIAPSSPDRTSLMTLSNHSGYGIGVLLISPHGDHVPRSVRLAFSDRHPATNNIVEYEACILGLETALELGIRQMEVFGDSNLVLRQIQGEWKTRDAKLRPYHAYLELLVTRFEDLRYTHLPRAQNQFADALATLASMIDIPADATVRPLLIESRSAPAYCCLIDDMEIDDGLPWYHDIYHFLRLGVYPEAATAKDRRALRQLATRFVICGETLYRRSPDGMLLLCLDRASADRVMREVHAGVCGPHMGGHMLARKIMRTGYFWLTMETDCCQFVQRCPECQIHGDLIHVPPSELHALTSPWPFSVWGIDIIGKISPKSSSGHEFILVAIDYFTKWVEAASYARLTSSGVASFIRSHIICRYGVPHELISDRGVHFRAEVDTLVQRYSIRHHRSTAYRPQTNGAVEAANKNIKRILRKMVETSRDWSEKLPFALWAYRTSFRTSTGATPYSLVYGMEAVLPVEIEMGSLRVALEQQIPETDWAQARFDQLNLLDERRLRAADHVRAYQRKMARAFKKRVKPRPLHVGDLVLRVIRGLIRDPRGKFRPSWSGPYFIRELTPEGAAWLMDLDGNQFSEPTNVDQLKSLICFICLLVDTMFTLGTISFPSFLSPYHPSLHYVPCLKTTLRPWDQISSSTASMWTGAYFRSDEIYRSRGSCVLILICEIFILFDIVVIPGWGYVECLDPHVIISVRYTSGLLCIPMVLFSGHQGRSVVHRSRLVEPLLAIHSSLRFAAACHTGAYFPHIVSLQSGVQSRRSFTVYDIQSHHVTFFSLVFRATSQFDVQSHHHHFLVSAFRAITASQFRRSEPSSVFRSTFRVAFSVSAFRVVITSQLRCSEPSSLLLLVSAFRAIIDFQIDIQSHILGFGVQSRHRAITTSQFRRSEPSSVFRSTFRVAFSVSAFRVVITSQLRCSEPSSLLLSVSAFKVVIGFQIDVQSRVLGFGVQSRYHFSASVFRAIITTSLSFGVQSHHRFSDRRSESRSRFRRSESLSLLSFGVQSHHHYFSQFRRSESSSVFRSTFRVAFSVSAFRVVITSQLRCSEPSSLLLSVSAFRVVIGFQIDVQSRVLGFGVQSRYHFSVSVFRAIITTSLSFGVQSHHRFSDRHSESPPRFRRSESLSLLSLTFRVIIITSQFRRSELSSVFRSTFRVASSVSAFRVVITSQFDVQSHHHHFLVSTSRSTTVILFRLPEPLLSSCLGFQSHYRHLV
ncbi:Gypsy retrotransposon integrase-like protein 1 [Vitis vinifera]|uniref:Gypsy retrotransposon integrase-like protein 1 n=1 Tax=Vitis vinifera TaxID=29760 RepID=A0A438FQE6_VITVI|nr:Gypsy retrotransposon integrase-like protein 1 [Vitis vinifera]